MIPASGPARARFAPSPTGRLHIGGARTALYDFLLARQTGGQFILRIEDTDRKRWVAGAEEEQREALAWLGLTWDEGPEAGGPAAPYRQSERGTIYREHAARLVASGHAYPCFCTAERLAQVRQEQQKRKMPPRYDGRCRDLTPDEARRRLQAGESHVIRFRTPREGTTTGEDLLRGSITVENSSLDDYILLKSDGLPVYHLAALVDDQLMRISHVLRSSEWLPTFPLHVLIYRAFGWVEPIWVHLSVFLNPTGKGKMSKRVAQDTKAGVQSIYVLDLKQAGYLPEAVINWIALMGWSLDDHTEFLPLPDLIRGFSLPRLQSSPAAVNFSKLDHFNGLYIRALAPEDLARRLLPFFEAAGMAPDIGRLGQIVPLIQERIRTLEEAVEIAGFLFREEVAPDLVTLLPPGADTSVLHGALQAALDATRTAPEWRASELESTLRAEASRLGMEAGDLFRILRAATTGQPVSPPLTQTMEILGKDLVLRRIEATLHAVDAARRGTAS